MYCYSEGKASVVESKLQINVPATPKGDASRGGRPPLASPASSFFNSTPVTPSAATTSSSSMPFGSPTPMTPSLLSSASPAMGGNTNNGESKDEKGDGDATSAPATNDANDEEEDATAQQRAVDEEKLEREREQERRVAREREEMERERARDSNFMSDREYSLAMLDYIKKVAEQVQSAKQNGNFGGPNALDGPDAPVDDDEYDKFANLDDQVQLYALEVPKTNPDSSSKSLLNKTKIIFPLYYIDAHCLFVGML
jgi:hypothetical protein